MAYEAENLVSGIELGAAAILGGVFSGMANARQRNEVAAAQREAHAARIRTASAAGREHVLRSTVSGVREQLDAALTELDDVSLERDQLLAQVAQLRRDNAVLARAVEAFA